jgi:hypothetical protein
MASGNAGTSPREPGRPQKPVDPGDGPLSALVQALRDLREECGNPTYRTLQRYAGISHQRLAEAARGDQIPSWSVVEGYVNGCRLYRQDKRGGQSRLSGAEDLAQWRQLYRDAGGNSPEERPAANRPAPDQSIDDGPPAAVPDTHRPADADGKPTDDQPRTDATGTGTRRWAYPRSPRPRTLVTMAALLLAAAAGTGLTTALLNTGTRNPPPASPTDMDTLSPQPARPEVQPLNGYAKMQLQRVKVPLTSQLAKTLDESPATMPRTVMGYEFRSAMDDSAPVCLGASTTGPQAGRGYDPVLAVTCSTRAASEIWIPAQWEQDQQNVTWLVNDQYPSMCLNVNKDLGNGSPTQLWNCYRRAYGPYGLAINEAWNFGDWYANRTSASNPSPFFLSPGNFCLDAGNQGAESATGANELLDGTEVGIQDCADPTASQYWY